MPWWPRRARSASTPPTSTALAPHAGALGPAWRAVGEFLGDYLDVLDAEGVTDYTEIVHRAALLAHDPVVQPTLRDRFRAVYVDEFQDTDPAQVRLLRGLVGPETTFVVVGDPDQSIYTFRGADPGGILGFRDAFPSAEGGPAPTVVLRSTRRFGPVVRDAAARVLRTASLAPLPADIQRLHRSPVCEGAAYGDGTVEVRTFDSESAEAGHIADTLRRAHLEQGVPWNEMAVLVRSGRRSVPPLRRALTAAGVPVEVAADELPLHEEAAVAPLLTLLGVVVDAGALDDETTRDAAALPARRRRPRRPAPSRPRAAPRRARGGSRVPAHAVGHPDPRARRAPGRRRQGPAADLHRVVGPRRACPARARPPSPPGPPAARRARRGRGAGQRRGGAVVGVVGHGRRAADRAGRSGSRQRRCAAATRAAAPMPTSTRCSRCSPQPSASRSATPAVAASPTSSPSCASSRSRPTPSPRSGVRGPAVRLLTAHRAKGLQWRLVVVASVQEGVWPDVRRRGSLLQPDRLERSGLVDAPPPAVLLAEERRLFYVACTRAQERLVVTAVRSALDDGAQPSRFLADVLGRELDRADHLSGRPQRPLSVPGLVAQLRCIAVDPARPAELRAAATRRLAVLAGATGDDGHPLVAVRRPGALVGAARPHVVAGAGARGRRRRSRSPAASSATMTRCPLQWFLGHEAHGRRRAHDRARASARSSTCSPTASRASELPADPPCSRTTSTRCGRQLGFEAAWQ